MSTTTQNLGLTQPQMTDQIDQTIPQLSNDLLIIDTSIGNLSNLTTTNKSSLVSAINENANGIGSTNTNVATNTANIGTLSSLTTTAKNNLVSAINEVNSEADSNTTAITTNTTNISTNTSAIGTLTNLSTTIKTNLVSAINEVIQYPVNSLSRQAVINGNFDVWQRGMSFTNPATFIYTADRWNVRYANTGTLPTTILHRALSLPSIELQGRNYYNLNVNGAGSGFGVNDQYQIQTRLENVTRLLCGSGKKVTLSFYARSSIAGKKLGYSIYQQYGSGGSPSAAEIIKGDVITLTSTFTKYTVTITTNTLSGKTFGTNIDDYVAINFWYMWGTGSASTQFNTYTLAETFGGSGDIDIAQVQVNAGEPTLAFQPKSFGEELSLCRRYFQLRSTNTVDPLDLSPTMRVNPTITGGVSPYSYSAEL